MPADAPPKTRRETWEDWLPPEGRDEGLLDAEPLLTRDELVAELNNVGHEFTARDLVYWQSMGVIPYPTRQKRRGRSIAVYPQWMLSVIHTLRNAQEAGHPLREIGPILRDDVFHMFSPRPQTPEQEKRHAERRARQALFPLHDELDRLIRSFARIHEQIHGGRIVRADLMLRRDDGTGRAYVFFAGDDTGEDREQIDNVDDVKDMV